MDIAICEDNPADAAAIRSYLFEYFERNCFTGSIHMFDSGEALLKAFTPGSFDACFLDVYMSGITGVETARAIRKADPFCALVFITSSSGHMADGYSLRAASYVVKPITSEQMETALLQCRGVFLKNARYIEVSFDRQTVRIPLIKIFYVEVMDKVTYLYTIGGIFKTYMPLDEIERKVGSGPFLRCHRAFLVNMNHVQDILESDFLMRNGDKVPLRKNGRSEIRLAMNAFLSQRLFEEG